jgi:intracellular septation protein
VFGGLTVWLDDELFIKLKVTVVEALIGGALLIGLACKKLFIKHLLGASLAIDDEGWRKLTLRFAFFSFGLAGANEVARAQLSTDHWVWFKVGGLTLATMLFMLAQMPLLKRHSLPATGESDGK